MLGRRSTSRWLVSIVPAAALVLMTVAPAAAASYSREPYTWSDSGGYECGDGNWVDWAAEGGGTLAIRAGTGDHAGAFFAHDSYFWHSKDVRRSDGKSLTITGHGTFVETKATHVSGTIFDFTSVDAGQTIIRDGDGDLIVRDRGSIRQTLRYDTLGDDQPGGELIDVISFRVNGQHPGLDFDTCSVFG